MKTDKKPVIGLICVVLSCILVIGITLGLLSSANNNSATVGSTADALTDNKTDTTEEPPVDEPEPEPAPQPELESGYIRYGIPDCILESRWPCHMAYKSDKNTFDIDNVKITISYGGNFSRNIESESEKWEFHEMGIAFLDKLCGVDTKAKTIEEKFASEKFRVTSIIDRPNDLIIYEFNHSEELTIPKELFCEEQGVIGIGLYATLGEEKLYNRVLTCVQIGYQLSGTNEVVLSSPFKK